MRNIFDSHAHYDDPCFDEDRDELLSGLPERGVSGIINCGSSLEGSRKSAELAAKYDYIFASAGVHPSDVGDGVDIPELCLIARLPKMLAIGEIGLDYHYEAPGREVQRKWFIRQMEAAADLKLPVIIHNRDAHADTLEILKRFRLPGIMHCFSGSVEYSEEILKLGMYIALGGAVTFRNARQPKEVAREIPADRLLLETDAPYLSPDPYRGKRNDSSRIEYTARAIAEIRGMDVQELLDTCAENTRRLFGLPA